LRGKVAKRLRQEAEAETMGEANVRYVNTMAGRQLVRGCTRDTVQGFKMLYKAHEHPASKLRSLSGGRIRKGGRYKVAPGERSEYDRERRR
jgi:hypothetical protein